MGPCSDPNKRSDLQPLQTLDDLRMIGIVGDVGELVDGGHDRAFRAVRVALELRNLGFGADSTNTQLSKIDVIRIRKPVDTDSVYHLEFAYFARLFVCSFARVFACLFVC